MLKEKFYREKMLKFHSLMLHLILGRTRLIKCNDLLNWWHQC